MLLAAFYAARTRSRKYKREISLEYLTDEKHYPLGTTDGYFQAPEPDEEYILTLCGDAVIFSSGLLVEALLRLDEQKREMICLSLEHSTARNRQTVQAQPQHSGLLCPKSPEAAPSGNGENSRAAHMGHSPPGSGGLTRLPARTSRPLPRREAGPFSPLPLPPAFPIRMRR